ncbi:MAG: hypothetical protein KAR21_16730 [Spirochaetales bacterium]|nr:hypothetical protein [Spirochaetales bacterium]
MKKKLVIIVFICFIMVSNIFSDDFGSLINNYVKNQKKIRTFIGRGSITVMMMNSENNLMHEIESSISLYMKYPDLFKLIVENPARTVMVQKGNLMSQKIEGVDTIITKEVDENSDLFKKYFNYGIEDTIDTTQIESQTILNENGLVKFRIKPQEHDESDVNNQYGFTIDYTEMYFNSNDMLTKIIVYSDDKEMIKTEMQFMEKDGIFVAKQIRTETYANNMKIINIIEYDAVNLNTEILDKEFEIR